MNLNWRERKTQLVNVTPAAARELLAKHNTFNRGIKVSVVESYAGDMRAGRWHVTHQGIAFDWNGQLIDGQHRLAAVASAECPVGMMVTTGLDPLSRTSVDTHSKRTIEDAFVLSARGGRLIKSVGSRTCAAMWSRMIDGLKNMKGTHTRSAILEFSDAHAEAGEWTVTQFAMHSRTRNIYVGPVLAAVARACYHVDRQRLSDFVRILCTGFQRSPGEDVVIQWRNVLLAETHNSNSSAEIYGKTARVLIAYVNGEPLRRIYCPEDEPFPLPNESAAEADLELDLVASGAAKFAARGPSTPAMARGAGAAH